MYTIDKTHALLSVMKSFAKYIRRSIKIGIHFRVQRTIFSRFLHIHVKVPFRRRGVPGVSKKFRQKEN